MVNGLFTSEFRSNGESLLPHRGVLTFPTARDKTRASKRKLGFWGTVFPPRSLLIFLSWDVHGCEFGVYCDRVGTIWQLCEDVFTEQCPWANPTGCTQSPGVPSETQLAL